MTLLRNVSRGLPALKLRIVDHGAVVPQGKCAASYTTGPSEWGNVGRMYTIHPETLSYYQKRKELGLRTYGEVPVAELRRQMAKRSEVFAGQVNFTGTKQQTVVSYPGRNKGQFVKVPVSVYKPPDLDRMASILIYFHGGGMVSGSRETHSTMLETIAMMAKCVVVSVEYRLAPEHKIPAAFDDCRGVTHWVLNNKVMLGGHLDCRVGVSGDGSGGQLSAIVAHDIRGLSFQVLVNPLTDFSPASMAQELRNTPAFNEISFQWMVSQILAEERQRTDPWFVPALRPDESFAGVPPTLCVLSQLGALRDSATAYCDRIRKAGVKSHVVITEGAPHDFFILPGHFKFLTQSAYSLVATFIKQFRQW